MINKFILPFIAIIILSSCADKFSLQKRKYNKGYYFDLSHKKQVKKTESVAENQKTKTSAESEPIVNEVAVSVNSESKKESKVIPFINTTDAGKLKNDFPDAKRKLTASTEAKKEFEQKSFKQVEISPAKKQNKSTKGGSADANLIVMIILCLFPFICLIPVYLHDGKSITLNFWIDLLLHLTFIGEIIFALLVVLDVVDLA